MTERAPPLEEGSLRRDREILSPGEFASYRVYRKIIAPLGIGEILTRVVRRRPGRRGWRRAGRGDLSESRIVNVRNVPSSEGRVVVQLRDIEQRAWW